MQYIQTNHPETQESQNNLYYFINAGYTFSDRLNKGWTGEIGYLINPNDTFYREKTIKMSAHKKLGKHLKVGPEIIFTNNFKNIIPGLSVQISS